MIPILGWPSSWRRRSLAAARLEIHLSCVLRPACSGLRAPACVLRPERCDASLRSGQQGLRHELLWPRVQFRFGWRRPGFLTHLIVQVLAFDPDIDGVV